MMQAKELRRSVDNLAARDSMATLVIDEAALP
jgi:hypothetical protein